VATATPAYAASHLNRLQLAPIPCRIGQPLCLYFDRAPASCVWEVFNTGNDKVADLSFGAGYAQCWTDPKLAPGMYFVRLSVVYQDGRRKEQVIKAVMVRR
jgi:hypothetical protein